LYVFYSSKGDGFNDSCLVYNINLRLWESFDTGLPIASTIARQTASNRFICGSNHFGQLFSYETQNNAYADLGAPIDFDLEIYYRFKDKNDKEQFHNFESKWIFPN
jgi:hypothetical protein